MWFLAGCTGEASRLMGTLCKLHQHVDSVPRLKNHLPVGAFPERPIFLVGGGGSEWRAGLVGIVGSIPAPMT